MLETIRINEDTNDDVSTVPSTFPDNASTEVKDLTLCNTLETIRINEDTNDDVSTVPSTFPDNASIGVKVLTVDGKNVNNLLIQIAVQLIKNSDLYNTIVDNKTNKDKTTIA